MYSDTEKLKPGMRIRLLPSNKDPEWCADVTGTVTIVKNATSRSSKGWIKVIRDNGRSLVWGIDDEWQWAPVFSEAWKEWLNDI